MMTILLIILIILLIGALPTWQVSWDQPHEGNLFEHLYARRALQGRLGVA